MHFLYQFTVQCKLQDPLLLEDDLHEIWVGSIREKIQLKVIDRTDKYDGKYIQSFVLEEWDFTTEEAVQAAMLTTRNALLISLYGMGIAYVECSYTYNKYPVQPSNNSLVLSAASVSFSAGSATIIINRNDYDKFAENFQKVICKLLDNLHSYSQLAKAIEIYHSAKVEQSDSTKFIRYLIALECVTPPESQTEDDAVREFLIELENYTINNFSGSSELRSEILERLEPKEPFKQKEKKARSKFVKQLLGKDADKFIGECYSLRNTYIHGHKTRKKEIDEEIQARMREKVSRLEVLVANLLKAVAEDILQIGES